MRTLLTAASILLATTTSSLFANSGWLTNYDDAVKESKSSGKPILANFTGSDWCGWCIKLHKEVFSKDEFKTWAAENVVLLELDFPRKKAQTAEIKAQNKELKKKHAIRGFPTVLILDSDGNKMGQTGYRRNGPTEWTNYADLLIASHKNGGADEANASPQAGTRLQGKLISKNDNEIVIELENGKRLTIPTKNLKQATP
jgi:protein disulfide-isomerase